MQTGTIDDNHQHLNASIYMQYTLSLCNCLLSWSYFRPGKEHFFYYAARIKQHLPTSSSVLTLLRLRLISSRDAAIVHLHPPVQGWYAYRYCNFTKTSCYTIITTTSILTDIYNFSLLVFTRGYYFSVLLHPFNSLFPRTIWISWYEKGKTSLDLNEARDDRIWNIVASAGLYANNVHLTPDR